MSRKLESVVPQSLINTGDEDTDNPLGKWTATLFYVSHKKCLLITNSIARYTIILDNMTAANFPDLSKLFAKTLYDQLLIDGIKIDWLTIQKSVGEVDLCSTDNDRTLIGVQNNILQYIDDWKYEFGSIDNWPFRELNRRINGNPSKELGWLFPREKMKIILHGLKSKA